MRVVIQRVKYCRVVIDSKKFSSVGRGLAVLVGVEDADTREDADWLAAKICKMRLFDDADGVMNLSVVDAGGDIMAISQFTLMASTRKGNRPSYIRAAAPGHSKPLYDYFVERLGAESGTEVKTGVFGADMAVELLNDGPVTIVMDTKNRE